MPDQMGIRPGLSEPYDEDQDRQGVPTGPDEEIMAMFAEDNDGDQIDTEPDPVDPPAAPASPPVADGDPGAAADPAPPAPAEPALDQAAAELPVVEEPYEVRYRELQRAFTQVAQDHQRRDREYQELQAYVGSQQEQFDQLVTLLQEREAENDPEFAEALTRNQEIDRLVAERLAPFEEEREQQQQREQQTVAQTQAEQAVAVFYRDHADIVPGSAPDLAMAQTFQQLRGAGVPLDIRRVEHLEIAREASVDPNFAAELAMQPGALNIPDGLTRLRARAGATVESSTGATPPGDGGTRQPGSNGAPARRRLEASLEVGSGGAPVETAPGTQTDEFDEATKWYKNDFQKGILFGAQRT